MLFRSYTNVVIAGDMNTFINDRIVPCHFLSGEKSNGDNGATHIVDYAFANRPMIRRYAPLPRNDENINGVIYRVNDYLTPEEFMKTHVVRQSDNPCITTESSNQIGRSPAKRFVVITYATGGTCTLTMRQWGAFRNHIPYLRAHGATEDDVHHALKCAIKAESFPDILPRTREAKGLDAFQFPATDDVGDVTLTSNRGQFFQSSTWAFQVQIGRAHV